MGQAESKEKMSRWRYMQDGDYFFTFFPTNILPTFFDTPSNSYEYKFDTEMRICVSFLHTSTFESLMTCLGCQPFLFVDSWEWLQHIWFCLTRVPSDSSGCTWRYFLGLSVYLVLFTRVSFRCLSTHHVGLSCPYNSFFLVTDLFVLKKANGKNWL